MELFQMFRNDADFDLFDDVFNVPMFGRETLMRTDVKQCDGKYIMNMDLPGYNKEDIHISLNDGNLTVSAEHHGSKDEKDNDGNVIRQERFSGSCSRTFFVGRNVQESDVHASYNNGTLSIEVPDEEKKEIENRKYIEIA